MKKLEFVTKKQHCQSFDPKIFKSNQIKLHSMELILITFEVICNKTPVMRFFFDNLLLFFENFEIFSF